jgi:hypothetical protein
MTRKPRLPVVRESVVLRAVLAVLQAHPRVAFVWRANTISQKIGLRYIKAGFVGQPDVLGMLKDGQFLACEVKRPGGKLTDEQAAFLELVNRRGGLGFMATSVDDVMRALK